MLGMTARLSLRRRANKVEALVEALVGALVEALVGALVEALVESLVEALVEAFEEALVVALVHGWPYRSQAFEHKVEHRGLKDRHRDGDHRA